MGTKNTKQKNNKLQDNNDIKNNVKNKRIKINKYVKGVSNLLILQDGRLSCSYFSGNADLIIYKRNYKDVDLKIDFDSSLSYHIQLNNGNIVTSSYDNNIRIIKLLEPKNYKVIQTLNDHTNYVLKILEFKKNNIISCSFDQTMKIFMLKNEIYHCTQSIIICQSDEDYSHLLFTNYYNEIMTSSYNYKYIKIWNIKNIDKIQLKTCIKNIPIKNWGNSMTKIKDKLFVGTQDHGICIINLKTYQKVYIIEQNLWDITSIINLKNDYLMVGSYSNRESSIIKFKYENNKLLEIDSKNIKKKENIYDMILLNNGEVIISLILDLELMCYHKIII